MAKSPKLHVVEKVTAISTKSLSGDSWTPLQLLQEFVKKVESGEVKPDKLCLHWMETLPSGRTQPRRWQAGCSRSEEIALLEVAKQMAIEDWRS